MQYPAFRTLLLVLVPIPLLISACANPPLVKLSSEPSLIESFSAQRSFSIPDIQGMRYRPVGRVPYKMIVKTNSPNLNDVELSGYAIISRTGSGLIHRETYADYLYLTAKDGRTLSFSIGNQLTEQLDMDEYGKITRIYIPLARDRQRTSPSIDLTDAEWDKIKKLAFSDEAALRSAIAWIALSPVYPVGAVTAYDRLIPQNQSEINERFREYGLRALRRGGMIPDGSSAANDEKILKELVSSVYEGYSATIKVEGSAVMEGLEYLRLAGSFRQGSNVKATYENFIDPYSGNPRYVRVEVQVAGGFHAISEQLYDIAFSVPKEVAPSLPRPIIEVPSNASVAPVGSVAGVYHQALSSVVTVITNKVQGSGFVVEGGMIATNRHVVEGATRVIIHTSDGRKVRARVLSSIEDDTDFALLVPEEALNLPDLPLLGDVPLTGSQALVIGTPEGFGGTLTLGIVSQFRTMEGLSWVQIDAAVNPGNSGGPVLNTRGQVIGMATFGWKKSTGLNFALSALEIRRLISKARTLGLSSILMFVSNRRTWT